LDSIKSISDFNSFLESIKNTDDKVKKLSILSKYININSIIIDVLKNQRDFHDLDSELVSKLISTKIFHWIDEKWLKYLISIKKDPKNIDNFDPNCFWYDYLLKWVKLIFWDNSEQVHKFIEISKDSTKKNIDKYRANIDIKADKILDWLKISDDKERKSYKDSIIVCSEYAFKKIASDPNLSINDYKRVFLNYMESIHPNFHKKLWTYQDFDKILLWLFHDNAKIVKLNKVPGITTTTENYKLDIWSSIPDDKLTAIISKNIADYKRLNTKDDVNIVYKNVLRDWFQTYVDFQKSKLKVNDEQKLFLEQLLYEVNSISLDTDRFREIICKLSDKWFDVSDLNSFLSKEIEIKRIIVIWFSKYLPNSYDSQKIDSLIDQSSKILSDPIKFAEYVQKSNEIYNSQLWYTYSANPIVSTNLWKQQEHLPSKIEYIDWYKARNPFYDKEKNDKSEETIEWKNKIDLNKKIILKYFESSGYKINQIVWNLDDITFKEKLWINLNQDLTKQDFENITMSFGRLFVSKIEINIEKYSKWDPIRKILEETKKKLITNPVEWFREFLEFVWKNEDVVYKLWLYEWWSFVEKKLSIDMMEDYIWIREYYHQKQKELNLK